MLTFYEIIFSNRKVKNKITSYNKRKTICCTKVTW